MPIAFVRLWIAPIALAAVVFLSTAPRSLAAPDPIPADSTRSSSGVEVEVKCIDDSTLKLKVLDEKLELTTKYGVLQIAATDIRRIEFARRCPAEVVEKIVSAISKLGHPDFQTRERATAELRGYRERAYPYLLKAIKNDDPEVSRRADETVKFIQSRVPAADLVVKEFDVVHTEDSKLVGKLSAHTLRVNTLLFGEQQLKLADLRSLKSSTGTAADDLQTASPPPVNLIAYERQFGKELVFSIVGFSSSNGQQPSLWGTDVYSLDSTLSAAAVHAGMARAGEPAVVRVRIVQSPQQFIASFRNGLTSTAYANYPAGAFEFVRR